MAPEEVQKSNQITPEIAEKKVSEAVEDIVEDQDFIIEDDGDFFWVIQRISWGIIKTLFILSLIGVLIWIIWGGRLPFIGGEPEPITSIEEPINTSNPAPKAEKDGWFSGLFGKDDTKTETPPSTTPSIGVISPNPTIVNNINLEKLSYTLAEQNVDLSTGTTITQVTAWLKQVKSLVIFLLNCFD